MDYDAQRTLQFMEFLTAELPQHSRIAVVDPVSHQFCCEKETQTRRFFEQRGHQVVYQKHMKVSVSRSVLEPAIASLCDILHLQINRDIKLSCHTWSVIVQLEHQLSRTILPPPNVKQTLVITPLPCISYWQLFLHRFCHTNVWILPTKEDKPNVALYRRLFRAWYQFGGVLCIPYSTFVPLLDST